MKIMIFLHGTIIMHKNAAGKTRAERVSQSLNQEESVLDYASYIPIGEAVAKLNNWKQQSAEIIYLSSHDQETDVEKDRVVLNKYGFPTGEVMFSKYGESYGTVVEKVRPDILIEDDCESIGGRKEMAINQVSPEIQNQIKSIVVKEFEGIDRLPDEIKDFN